MSIASLLPHGDVFQEVKDNVSIDNVVEYYNITELRRQGKHYMGICPLHNDQDPSMAIYSSTNRYKCFGCGASGDLIDLVAKHFDLSLIEAAKLIGRDFGLQLDRPMSKEEKQRAVERSRKIKQNSNRIRAFNAAVDRARHEVSFYIRTINNTLAGGYKYYYQLSDWLGPLNELEHLDYCLGHPDIEMKAAALKEWEEQHSWYRPIIADC